MTTATTYIEVERPLGWKGEAFDYSTFDGETDYFEVEVEGSIDFWTDPNYGADADGNRGISMSGAEVEEITFTLYGDFRPFYIKIRDYFLLKWANRSIFKITSPNERLLPSRPVKWTQLSDYGYIKLDDNLFDASEIEKASDKLIQEAEENCEAAADDYYDE